MRRQEGVNETETMLRGDVAVRRLIVGKRDQCALNSIRKSLVARDQKAER